jgi:hypothetical protein
LGVVLLVDVLVELDKVKDCAELEIVGSVEVEVTTDRLLEIDSDTLLRRTND